MECAVIFNDGVSKGIVGFTNLTLKEWLVKNEGKYPRYNEQTCKTRPLRESCFNVYHGSEFNRSDMTDMLGV
jgi:hypothetical protein